MKFEHRLAGNANTWRHQYLGRTPTSSSMVRAFILSTFVILLLAPSSQAADPLLSGYGGPGGGEQVVLGSTLVGAGKGGGGSGSSGGSASLRASAAPVAATPAQGSTASTAPASPNVTRKPAGRSPAHRAARHAKPGATHPAAKSPSSTPRTTATAAAPGAPPVRVYPSRASDAGGLPLSTTDVLLGLLALVALVLVGAGLRQVGDPGADTRATPQAMLR